MAEATKHFEAGIYYSLNPLPKFEPADPAMVPVEYYWISPGGFAGMREVYIYPEDKKNFQRLLDHWSIQGWDYFQ